ncbi:hypothetical protein [Gallibacterium anatis]|uniref:hypothetical protein n=2 Tax=Gallibacterium anatis TaxID=750 RepID=UPI000A8E5A93|nr:hypothetical protein [Gallibacterium anatis]
MNDLIAKAETAKEAAQQAVDGLPAGEYKTAKDGEVKAIDVPTNASETPAPTVTVALVEDTGSDAADGVTNNGKITVSVDKPYSVESVTVNGSPLVKGEDGQYQLPEGTYSKDDIQVVVAHEKGGQINANTALSPASVTVDTTAPTEAPEVDGESRTVTLPADAQEGDVVTVTVTNGDGEPQVAKLVKGADGWTSDNDAVSVDGNSATVSEAAAPAGATITASYADKAGNTSDELSAQDQVPVLDPTNLQLNGQSANGVLSSREGNAVTGTVENADGGKAQLIDPVTGRVVAEAEVQDGAFSIDVTNVPKDESYTTDAPKVYQVKVVDGDKSTEPADITIDKTAPKGRFEVSPADDLDGIQLGGAFADDYWLLTSDEIGDKDYLSVKVKLPTGTQVGDVITGEYGKGAGTYATTPMLNSTKVTAEDLERGYAVIENAIPAPAEGEPNQSYQVSVRVAEPYTNADLTSARDFGTFEVRRGEVDSSHIKVQLANDTKGTDIGSETDGISKDGTLKFVDPTGKDVTDSITSVTANGTVLQKTDGVWKLPEGTFASGAIKASTAQGGSIGNSSEIVVDNTIPNSPQMRFMGKTEQVRVVVFTQNMKEGDRVTVTIDDVDYKATFDGSKLVFENRPDYLDDTHTGPYSTIIYINDPHAGMTVSSKVEDLAGNSVVGIDQAKTSSTVVTVPDSVTSTPMRLSSFTVEDTQPNVDGTQNDRTIEYNYQLSGKLDSNKQVRVRLIDKETQETVATEYVDATEATGSATITAPKEGNYTVVADIVLDTIQDTPLASGGKKQADVEVIVPDVPLGLDESLEEPMEIVDYETLILDFSKPVTSDHSEDTVSGSKVTFKFEDKGPTPHIVTDEKGDKIAVYNIRNDWSMKPSDDYDHQGDHAEGWFTDTASAKVDNPSNPPVRYYYAWNGKEDMPDYIIVNSEEMDGRHDKQYIGNLGTEQETDTKQSRFVVDTKAGGDDVMVVTGGIIGNARIITNDGDDFITATYMNGQSTASIYADGSQQIYMGSGNDHFELTGKASDRNVGQTSWWDSTMFYTNAKIDMGEGDDTVHIAGHSLTGRESSSGNYYNLGSGNDKLIVDGQMVGRDSRDGDWKSSHIVNLGSGDDLFTAQRFNEGGKFGLVLSDDSSTINLQDVAGRTSFMLGAGKDDVTINTVNLENDKGDYSLSQIFANNVSDSQTNPWYRGFYDDALKNSVNQKLAATNAKVGNDSLGSGSLASNVQYFASRFDFGDGENTLKVGTSATNLNYVGGKDNDTVTVGDATYSSRFWMGNGENTLTVQNNYNDSAYSGGTGTDTVTIKGSASGSFNLGSGTNNLDVRVAANNVTYNSVSGADTRNTIHAGEVSGGTYNFASDGATTIMNVDRSVKDGTTFIFGTGANTTNELHIGGSVAKGVTIQAGNANDFVDVDGSFTTYNREQVAVNFGDGKDHLRIGGATQGLRVDTGNDNDVVDIGIGLESTGPYNMYGMNTSAGMYDDQFNLGDGDDVIRIASVSSEGLSELAQYRDASSGVYIYAGKGNDTITVYNIWEKYTYIFGEDGDDTINLYSNVKADNTVEIKGGNGFDTLNIGTSGDSVHAQFSLGNEKSGYTEVQNVEKLVFMSTQADSSDTIYVNQGSLVDGQNGEVRITLGKDVDPTINTVQLDSHWKQNTGHEGNEAGKSYMIDADGTKYYTYNCTGYWGYYSDDWLLIDARIVDNGMVKY